MARGLILEILAGSKAMKILWLATHYSRCPIAAT